MIKITDLLQNYTSDRYPVYSCGIETDDAKFINYLLNNQNVKCSLQKVTFGTFGIENSKLPGIKNVIFNDPATIVLWEDGTKTVVQLDKWKGDYYFDKQTGLAMAICKKAFGNKGNFNEVFKKWIWDKEED